MCACAAARGSDSREGEAAHAEEGRKSPLRIAARAHDRRAEGGGEGAPTEDSGCARARRRVRCGAGHLNLQGTTVTVSLVRGPLQVPVRLPTNPLEAREVSVRWF